VGEGIMSKYLDVMDLLEIDDENWHIIFAKVYLCENNIK